MNRKVNPTLIGMFVLAGLAICVLIVAYLSSARLFTREATFVLYFDESVKGLSPGAGVRFKGVPIGQVREIRIHWNQAAGSSEVPVFVNVDLRRLEERLDVDRDLSDPSTLREQIELGLRGRLQMESLITGLLFVELDYVADPGPPRLLQLREIHPEIPTVPSAVVEVGQSASSIMTSLAAVDFKGIAENLELLLAGLNQQVRETDMAALSRSLIRTSDQVGDLFASGAVERSLQNADNAFVEFQAVLRGVDPVTELLAATFEETRSLAEDARRVVQTLDHAISPNAPLMYELQHTLQEFVRFAESARLLVEMLERNPRALLTGKQRSE